MITPEIRRMEKQIESIERRQARFDRRLEKLMQEVGYKPPEAIEGDKLSAMLALDRQLQEAIIAEGKAIIARAKSMTADDMRRIGRAHLRHVNSRYRVKPTKAD